jgi:hypothetical protein
MKWILMPAALALALAAGLTPAPVQAAGCLKGAAIGGVAGHAAAYPARPPTEHREAEMVPAIFSGETFFGTSDAEAPSSNEGAQYGQ